MNNKQWSLSYPRVAIRSGTRDDRLNILNLRIVWKPDTVNFEGLESDVTTDTEGLHIDCKVFSNLNAGYSTT